MNESELRQQILTSLSKVAPDADPSALDQDVNFRDQFELDSVDFLGFVLDLEQRLGSRIPEMDYPKLSSMKGCLRYFRPVVDGR